MLEQTGDECINYYEKAVELNPLYINEKYSHGYGKYLNKIKNYKKCYQIYEKLLKINECNEIALYESIKLIQNYNVIDDKKTKSICLYEKMKKYLSLNDKNYKMMKEFIKIVYEINENNIEKIYEECDDYIDRSIYDKISKWYGNWTNTL